MNSSSKPPARQTPVFRDRDLGVRRVAAAAAGLKCVLVQESWVDWPEVTYDRVGDILLGRLLGADVRPDDAQERSADH